MRLLGGGSSCRPSCLIHGQTLGAMYQSRHRLAATAWATMLELPYIPCLPTASSMNTQAVSTLGPAFRYRATAFRAYPLGTAEASLFSVVSHRYAPVLSWLYPLFKIKMMATAQVTSTMVIPIKTGLSTHHQLQLMTPVSFRTMNAVVSKPAKPTPFEELELVLMALPFPMWHP